MPGDVKFQYESAVAYRFFYKLSLSLAATITAYSLPSNNNLKISVAYFVIASAVMTSRAKPELSYIRHEQGFTVLPLLALTSRTAPIGSASPCDFKCLWCLKCGSCRLAVFIDTNTCVTGGRPLWSGQSLLHCGSGEH